MKTSNRLLIGFIGTIVVGLLISNIIVRANMVPSAPDGKMGKNGKDYPLIEGSGTIVKETREVASFTKINLKDGAEVILTMGETTSLQVEADKDLLPYIKPVVNNGVLTLNTEARLGHEAAKGRKYYLTVKDLSSIYLSGSGSITGTNVLTSSSLGLDLSGNGSLTLQVEAEKINASLNGSGTMKLSGSVGHLKGSIGGNGDIDAKALEANSAQIMVAGSGDAFVWANEKLNLSVGGSGTITYKGDAKVTKSIGGIGDIIKAED